MHGQDEHGNDVYSESQIDVGPCSVQPSSSRETLAFTDQLSSRFIVFVPYGTDVQYIDAIIIDGVKYEVTGQPDIWVSPFTGLQAPIRIEATMIEGAAQ